jgi:tripartite-type tricarboxylate transporter receptor subunit TctC
MRLVDRFACAAAALAVFSAAPVAAQSVADFYKSHKVTLIIASGVGGGYDAYGRTLSRHIGRHIPGNPAVVVQNMDGASGMEATNFIANKAQRDGATILATYNSLLIQPLFNNDKVMFDVLTLGWIGSIGKQTNICMTWGPTSPVKTLEQAKGREMNTSSTGATSSTTQLPNVLNRLVGTKFKPIIGYSTNEMYLALERGEVDALCGLSYSTMKTARSDWILTKKLNILTQFGSARLAELPDVPLASDFVARPEDKQVFEMLAYPQEIGRPVVAPPEVPAERLQALRAAFDATMKDKEFLAESQKAFQDVDPLTGVEVAEKLKRAYATPKPVLATAADLLTNLPPPETKK